MAVEKLVAQTGTLSHRLQDDFPRTIDPVSYTHLRANETDSYLVCRLLREKKNTRIEVKEKIIKKVEEPIIY